MVNFTWGQAGLCVDIVGALLLAFSLASTQNSDVQRAANPTIAEVTDVAAMVLARQDTRVGIGVLIAGFLLQFAASWLPASTSWAVTASLLAGFNGVAYVRGRHRWAADEIARVRQQLGASRINDHMRGQMFSIAAFMG